jgi:hypothetical protein
MICINTIMIYLIHCKCHNVPPPSTAIKEKSQVWLLFESPEDPENADDCISSPEILIEIDLSTKAICKSFRVCSGVNC